jgi:hypothetical protein
VIAPEHAQRRLRLLVAAHLWLLVPDGDWSLPMLWATSAVPVGGLMTLAFWVGMGRSSAIWRLVVSLAGSAYLAIWQPVSFMMKVARSQSTVLSDWMSNYLSMATPYGITIIMFGSSFYLCGTAGR